MLLKIKIWLITILSIFITISCIQPKETLTINYIAHASFIISSDTTSILIDPFRSKQWIGYNFPENITADAVFITHPHYDHDGGRFLGDHPYWESTTKIYETPGVSELGNFKVKGIIGKHNDPYGKEFGQKNTIFKFEVADISLVHLGDNGPLTEANYKDLGKIDVLMIPIDSTYHILSHETIQEIIARLEPKLIIPMHYRISHLEAHGNPKNLGDIDPYLNKQPRVITLESNHYTLKIDKLPKMATYIKFKAHPNLKN